MPYDLQGKMAPSYIIEVLTTTKSVRSQSGVLPISVATDGNNFSCMCCTGDEVPDSCLVLKYGAAAG
jgi:hypothetical protein